MKAEIKQVTDEKSGQNNDNNNNLSEKDENEDGLNNNNTNNSNSNSNVSNVSNDLAVTTAKHVTFFISILVFYVDYICLFCFF